MKLQITIEDTLGVEIQKQAKQFGFSINSYAKFLIKKALNKQNKIEKALEEIENGEFEKLTLEEFKHQLENLRK